MTHESLIDYNKLPLALGDKLEFELSEDGSDSFMATELLDSSRDEAVLVPNDTIAYPDEMASYIIEACNQYPHLVEMLEAVYAWVASEDEFPDPYADDYPFIAMQETRDKAVRLVRALAVRHHL